MRNRFPALLAVTLMLFGGAPAFGESPDETLRTQIHDALLQPGSVRNTSWWLSLPPQAPAVMMAMYQSTSHVYERTKLIEALANFKDDSTVISFLKSQATAGAAAAPVRYAAIRSVGNNAGMREGDFLTALLQDSDPQARLEAAETLQRTQDPGGDRALRDYMSAEKATWIVKRLRQKAENLNQPRYVIHHQ